MSSASTTAHNISQAAETRTRAAADKVNPALEKAASHPVVQSTVNSVRRQLALLDKELEKNAFAREFEAKTKVPKTTAFLVIAVLGFSIVLFNIFGLAPAVTTAIGFALPAVASIQALESETTTDDRQWLAYWVVFGLATTLESAALGLIVRVVPRWHLIKTVALVALQLPSTRYAEKLYINVIRPVFVQKKLSQTAANAFSTATSAPVDAPAVDSHVKTL